MSAVSSAAASPEESACPPAATPIERRTGAEEEADAEEPATTSSKGEGPIARRALVSSGLASRAVAMIAGVGAGASRDTRPFVSRIARSVDAASSGDGVDTTTAQPAFVSARRRGPSSARASAGRETGSSMRKTSAPDTIARAMSALKRSHCVSSEGYRSTRCARPVTWREPTRLSQSAIEPVADRGARMFWRIVRVSSSGESVRISATEPMRPARRAAHERDGAATMRPACGSSRPARIRNRARARRPVGSRMALSVCARKPISTFASRTAPVAWSV